MEKKKSFYNSALLFGAVSVILYAVMLFFNSITPYLADDYVYMFSFYDGKPIVEGGFIGIFKSMYSHSFCMNGRAVSHGFEQLFMLFPKSIFNIINALLWVMLVYVIYRIINYRERKNCILYLAVAMAVWQYTPAFGQVYLWQVGSVNYLWGVFAGILFLSPYIFRFVHHIEFFKRGWQKVLFCIFSLVVGFYNEITSFMVIVVAAILLVLIAVMKKGRKFNWMTIAATCAVIGYVLLLMMPVEMGAKQSKFEISVLLSNFLRVTDLLKTHMLPVMIVWAVMFVLGIIAKIPKERLILSGIFAGAAVAASYMMIIARYIPDRCLITTAVFAVIAVGILIPPLLKTRYSAAPACYGAILAIVFAFSFVTGSADILNGKFAVSEREAKIEEMKAQGETDITLKIIGCETKYSPFYGIIDLQSGISDTWPNNQMAWYYGLNSILGEE